MSNELEQPDSGSNIFRQKERAAAKKEMEHVRDHLYLGQSAIWEAIDELRLISSYTKDASLRSDIESFLRNLGMASPD